MVVRASSCLRRAADGRRSEIIRYGRFLANEKVTLEALLAGWGEQTAVAAAGRHVLAIQDTSELNFRTTAERRRGLGEIGKGVGRGLLLHAMLALDAESNACLGLVAGEIWTRQGRVAVPHEKRRPQEKESWRWISTAEQAKEVLSAAAMTTVIDDREGDIYAKWASVAEQNFHLLTRSMHDRALVDGVSMYETATSLPIVDLSTIQLLARANRPARQAKLALRFGRVTLQKPQGPGMQDLPKTVELTLIEVAECDPPTDVEPLHWYLLTTHAVSDIASAWQIVNWYKKRWTIEQLFRILKTQGLQIEDSRVETADRLLKLTAIAAKAAVITLQLVQARDGKGAEPARIAFDEEEIQVLAALGSKYQGSTKLQSNPHPTRSLAWAAWIIARLGGWDGYPRTKPGPITIKHGLQYFLGVAHAWRSIKDVRIN
ncbi:MAG: IS4 family transposase [Xanthobacteraceae bacterium]|nr:IS4 family transposase [Xanthobacteraceae bacterium]